MKLRHITTLAVLVASLGLDGCGGNGSADASTTPMDRCHGGRMMIVHDPADDGVRVPYAREAQREAVAEKPGAFDILRVAIGTTSRLLCASVTFAEGRPPLEPGNSTLRVIGLELASDKRHSDRNSPVSRLEYGRTANRVAWAPSGSFDTEHVISGGRITGVTAREVQLAVPLRELRGITTARRSKQRARLDPRRFLWRISVASDCVPSQRHLIAFPSERKTVLPIGSKSDPADYCQ